MGLEGFQLRQTFLTIVGDFDLILLCDQQRFQVLADHLLVIDDEDSCHCLRPLSLRSRGQLDGERGALARDTFHIDPAAVIFW